MVLLDTWPCFYNPMLFLLNTTWWSQLCGECKCRTCSKFDRAWKERKWSLSVVSDSATPWTLAYQASPSMGFSRQEYWSGLPFSPPGDLPDPGLEPWSPALEADALTSEPPGDRAWSHWKIGLLGFSSVQFSRSVVSDSFRFHGLQHARLPCPSPTPEAYTNLCPSS